MIGIRTNLHKFKMAATSMDFAYNSTSGAHRRLFMVSIPTFSRSMNTIIVVITTLGNWFGTFYNKCKMAATSKDCGCTSTSEACRRIILVPMPTF